MFQRLVFAILFCLCGATGLKATHIVGGELTYRCLGNNQYELTLTVYRDCYTGVPWFDNPASIGVFDANWIRRQSFLVSLDSMTNDTLPIQLSNPCLIAPPDVCVHRSVYKKIVNLPYLAGGYHIVYQRCCRNNLIRNIIEPLDTGASFTVEVSESALEDCNAGAVFNYWPPVAICVNEPIDFDHSASDADGDSLVYRLCTPLTGANPDFPVPQPPFAGPYPPISWLNPYNLQNMLGGQPLTIQPQTGFLTGVPNIIGNFVVGVCVDEYREDQLISTTRRDFQYNVADCGKPLAAFFAPEALCDTLSLRFKNESFSASKFKWYFDLLGDTNQVSMQYAPQHMYPDTGWYTVMLVAQPGEPCTDTVLQTIHVTRTYASANLDLTFPDCDENGILVAVQDQSSDPMFGIDSWKWTLVGPDGAVYKSNLQNPQFLVDDYGDYALTLEATSGNGCVATREFPFAAPFPPINFLQDSVLICLGDSIRLFPDADPAFQYAWTPSDFLSSDTSYNPLAAPITTTTYNVTVSGNGPCVLEKSIKVKVIDPSSLSVLAIPPAVYAGDPVQLFVIAPDASSYQYKWMPSAGLSNAMVFNPIGYPQDTTLYTVMLSLSTGCLVQGSVLVPVITPFCEPPFVFFPTAFTPNGDSENDFLKLESKIVTEVYWVIYNRWGEKMFEAFSLDDQWDGNYKGKPQPVETYGYYLKVRCINGEESIRKGNVTLLR
jgi:gliding motility-associated-like protein